MTDIYRYQIISIKGKVFIIRFWSGQSQGLAPDLKVFWVSMLLDFFKYGQSQHSQIHKDLEKKLGKLEYLNRYDYKDEDDEKNFGEFVEQWELKEVTRINDEAYWSFTNNNNGYWNSEAIYQVTFANEQHLTHIKEGDQTCGT